MFLCPKYLFYSTEVLLGIYHEHVQQIKGIINGECIVKISRDIVEVVYEVVPF